MRRRRRGLPATRTLAALGALALFACSGSEPDVVIVGDSISVRTHDAYEAAFAHDHLTVEATEGVTLGGQLDTIARAVGERPDALVLELGTNDMGDWPGSVPDQVTLVLEEAKDLPCVLWVSIRTGSPNDAEFNGRLRTEAGQRGNFHVVDWAGLAADHPDWFVFDGIHPSDTGQAALAAAVHDAVDACVAR